jgi:uncharacterized protein YbaR (Trm112 family)
VTLAPQLLAVLVCPRCKGTLEHRVSDAVLVCLSCRLRYPIKNDIPIMLTDEATPL